LRRERNRRASDGGVKIICPIPAANRETLARLLPQVAKPKTMRRNTTEADAR
jgi:hypothetical protein